MARWQCRGTQQQERPPAAPPPKNAMVSAQMRAAPREERPLRQGAFCQRMPTSPGRGKSHVCRQPMRLSRREVAARQRWRRSVSARQVNGESERSPPRNIVVIRLTLSSVHQRSALTVKR